MPARNLAPAQSLPWRSWYSLQRWRTRAKHQLRVAPLCALCEEQGHIVPATIADHHPPHKGDYNKFMLGPLRSLCRDCHNRQWAVDARGYRSEIDENGFPIDPRHPFNRAGGASGPGRAELLYQRGAFQALQTAIYLSSDSGAGVGAGL